MKLLHVTIIFSLSFTILLLPSLVFAENSDTDKTSSLFTFNQENNFQIIYDSNIDSNQNNKYVQFTSTLKQQLESEIPTKHISCKNNDHIPVLRSNGNVACVTETTAEKLIQRNWASKVVYTNVNSNIDSNQTIEINTNNEKSNHDTINTLSTEKLIFTSEKHGVSAQGLPQPYVTIEIPSEVKRGVPFDIDYTWSWVKFDKETGEIDDIITYRGEEELQSKILVYTFDGLHVIGSSEEYSDRTIKPTRPNSLGYDKFQYTIPIPYENTKIHHGTITLSYNKPTPFPIEQFWIHIGNVDVNLYAEFDKNNGRLSEEPSDLRLMAMEDSRFFYKDTQYRNSEFVPSNPWENYTAPPKDSLDERLWDGLADFIREVHSDENPREFMLSDGFTDKFIDKFLDKYPDLKKNSIRLDSYFILPSAFATH